MFLTVDLNGDRLLAEEADHRGIAPRREFKGEIDTSIRYLHSSQDSWVLCRAKCLLMSTKALNDLFDSGLDQFRGCLACWDVAVEPLLDVESDHNAAM